MKNRTMSKQHTPTPKYKVHEFRNTLDIWTSNSTSFICSVPTGPDLEETAKEKINFVLNILNNHDRLVEALEDANRMLGQIRRSMMAHPDHEEGSEFDDMTTGAQLIENRIEKLLTELKQQ